MPRAIHRACRAGLGTEVAPRPLSLIRLMEAILNTIQWIRPALLVAAAASMNLAFAEVGKTDTNFMKKAAESGMLEIEASTLAESKASSDTVKSFASQMLKDHKAADSELKSLASSKGVELPTELPSADKKRLEALGALEGATFDREYAKEVGVKAHNKAVSLFREASTKSRDPDVKAFAGKTLPTLQHHLEMANKMANEVGKSPAKSAKR